MQSYKIHHVIVSGIVLSLGLLLTGCKVGPDFQSPDMATPDNWTSQAAVTETEPNLVQWWTRFGDEQLTSLVERAMESSLDLKQARSRIRQARASRAIASSWLWPSADVSGSATRGRTAAGNTDNLYQTGLDAGWELDIFGGTRRDIEAAQAQIAAAEEDLRDVWVTLAAEVALNYIDLRGYQQEIEILQRNLQTQQKTADLTRQRANAGLVSALDMVTAESQVATTAAQLPPLESAVRQTIYILSVLLGSEPSALLAELDPAGTIPTAMSQPPLGVPSELLRRRPDIRRAEAQVHAATAAIGVATADLFPKFTLTGSAGFSNIHSNDLFDWDRRIWSAGPSASWSIFDAGRIRANIEIQKALEEQYLLAYQQTVLAALRDVESALTAATKEQEHRDALQRVVDANRRAVELSTQLYTEGETDFLNVLTTQRALFSAEDALVNSNRNISTNIVALYKALGGGWEQSL
ncbi:MAG: efflux transporter outer membrane subunit [Anaerohalosphaeraceae bacterium]